MVNNRLLVFSPLYPPHVGGLESHAEQFNYHMTHAGYDITVFTPFVVGGSAWQEDCGGVKIIRFPAFEIIPNYPVPKLWTWLFWRQWNLVWRNKYDIIISRTRFFLTSLMALAYAKIKHTRWVHIEHGSDFVHLDNLVSSFLARLYDLTLGKLVFTAADKVIANSNASADFVQRIAPNKKTKVIYRGVDAEVLEKIAPNDKFKSKHQGKFVVTYCGRLIDGKGVPDLLDAISQAMIFDLLCLIIGDGPQKKQLMEQARLLKISDHILFLGELPWTEAISYIKISDAVVNPSYTEGLPTSLIEAALCEKAIIATDVGGTKEIFDITEGSFLFAPRNTGALTEYLATLASSPSLRQSTAKKISAGVRKKFDWANSVARYRGEFESILLP